jgi:large subunit ribosomal protein L18
MAWLDERASQYGIVAMAKGNKDTAARRQRIHASIRSTIMGTPVRPRLSIYRSNKYIYAQLIDDFDGHTLTSASSLEDGLDAEDPTDESRKVGEILAERAKEKGIEKAVFDRSGYKYHGRVKALAEGAREGGLHV